MQIEIIKFIQTMISPFWDEVFQLVTMTGEEHFYILVAAVIFWCVNKRFGYKLGFALLTSTIVNTALKATVDLARPIGTEGIRSLRVETATGQSFPSGHTQGATTLWVSTIIQVKKRWMFIIGTLAIILVGCSRLYLGVHWPIDVIGGMVIGVIWVFVSNYIFDYAEKEKKPFILMLIIIPMLIGMIFLRQKTYYTIAGTVFAFFIGYIIEKRYIQFDVRANKLIQFIKLSFGLAIIMMLKVTLKEILPSNLFSDFFRYFAIGLWITVGAPYIFKRCMVYLYKQVSVKNS